MNQFDNPHEWLDCPLIEINFEIFTKRICSILSRIRFTLGKDLREHTLKFCPIKSFLPLPRMGKTFHNWKHLVRTQSLTALVCLVFWRDQAFYVLRASDPGSVLPGMSPCVTLLPISNWGVRHTLRGQGGMSPPLPSWHPHTPRRRVTASYTLFSPVDHALF